MHGDQVINDILAGVYDNSLDQIRDAISDRRDLLGARKHREFRVGDRVRFVGLGMGAKYMNGEEAVVVERNPKTLWVKLTPESRARIAGTRFGRSSQIKVYPNSLELVLEGQAEPGLLKIVGPSA